MNAAYNEISCADAARMIGTAYTLITKWCKSGKINCINVSGGTGRGRYVLAEDEVLYIKKLKQKFGRNYMRKYRKDWKRGAMPVDKVNPEVTPEILVVKQDATIKSVVTNVTIEEPVKPNRVDIDEIAIKIGYIQDIKNKIEKLEQEKQKLVEEYDKLRAEVINVL